MGQQPNIELEISDLPRPVATTGPPRRWIPSRPGELGSPEDVPWGGPFGTTGPDGGYALSLVATRTLELGRAEHRHNVEAAVIAVAGARASHFGRAPTDDDIDIALLLFGLDPAELPSGLVEELAASRVVWFATIGHDDAKARALVSSIAVETLAAPPGETRARMAAGERLIAL